MARLVFVFLMLLEAPKPPDFKYANDLPKWLYQVTQPIVDAADNPVAQDRAVKKAEAEMAKVKGQNFDWRLRVQNVRRDGVIVEHVNYQNDDTKRNVVLSFVEPAQLESPKRLANFFAVKNQDFLAGLKRGDIVRMKGRIESVRFGGEKTLSFLAVLRADSIK